MSKHAVTYTCGHTGEIVAFGSKRSREWAVVNAERGLCPDCYEAKLAADRAAATEAAAREAAEQDLPALEGTEKQVAWALTIRQKFLAEMDQWLAEHPLRDDIDATPVLRAIRSIQAETSAKWWIENGRGPGAEIGPLTIRGTIRRRYADLRRADETGIPATPSAPASEVPTLRPETAVSETIAVVATTADSVAVSFPERRDDFRAVVKGRGFAWTDGRWLRKIGPTTGTSEDRAAEVANALLTAGFVVRVLDDGARVKAVSGEFAPEQTRWVHCSKNDEFLLAWPRDAPENETIYSAARKIPGSRWAKPYVVVPAVQFEAVLDLAAEFGFSIAPAAEDLVGAAREARAAALVVKPGEPPQRPAPAPRHADGEIDADLRDDD